MFSIDKKDNQLIFAGKTPSELDYIAGGTPCYVYYSVKKRTAEKDKATLCYQSQSNA
jgi:hypothetical protein